jgi:hypothetical protein
MGCGCVTVLALPVMMYVINSRNPLIQIPPPPATVHPNGYDYLAKAAKLAANGGQLSTGKPSLPVARQLHLAAADAPAIAAMKQAWRLPYVAPRSSQPGASFRNLARSLVFDSGAYAAANQPDAAAEAALDDVQMGETIQGAGALIGRLTGSACVSIGLSPLWDLTGKVSAQEVRACADRLATIDAQRVPFADTMRAEKWSKLADLMLVLRERNWAWDLSEADSDDESEWSDSDTSSHPSSRLARVVRFLNIAAAGKTTILRRVSHTMDEDIGFVSRPYLPTRRWPKPPADPVCQLFCYVPPDVDIRPLTYETTERLLMVTFALRAYRLERGAYPALLQNLITSGYLKAVPVDPFASSRSLSYRKRGSSFLLYSVGPDGVDNGGTPIFDKARLLTAKRKEEAYRVYPESKGDIVAGVNE